MSMIKDIVFETENLIHTFDRAIKNEPKISWEIKLELERYSWELQRTANHIKQLANFYSEV